MRLPSVMIGMIRMALLSLFSWGRIAFRLPVRLDPNVSLSVRSGERIRLGRHISLNRGARVSAVDNALITVGGYSLIGYNNVIVAREQITLGNHVMLGANVCIYDHDHVFRQPGVMRDLGYTTAPVTIGDNVWIGAGVMILKGVTIGSGSVIAAGTLVNQDIPENSLVYNRRELVIKPRITEREQNEIPG